VKSVDLRRLLSTSSGRRLFYASISASVLWSVIIVGNAFLLAEIISGTIGHKSHVYQRIAQLALLWLIRASFQSSFDHWCSTQAIRIKNQLRTHTTSQIENYASQSSARLSNILTKGLNSLDIYLGRFIPQMIFATITPLFVIVTLFSQDPISGFIALITLPFIPLFGSLIGRYSAESVMKKWQSLGILSAYFEDSLRGFATLKIFGRSKSQSKRIAAMGDAYADETMKVLRISFLSAFALELIATLSVAVIAVSIGLRLVSGSMDFRSALIVLVLAPEVYFPVRNAATLFHASQDGTQALRELEEIGRPPDESAEGIPLISAEITSLSWLPWEFKRDVKVPAAQVQLGQMLFILGESGIGKSTFANNLLGFSFDAPIQVQTQLGAFTLAQGMQGSWQELVGWIPQNPQLAKGTLRDQFRLLDAKVRDSQITNALAMAGLSLGDLPDGLDTKVGRGGEGSHSASGGQVRRIAVARALIRDPLLVIADEPTADLDRASADEVMRALRKVQANGAMVICITHDISLPNPLDSICSVARSN
jgi:ABC-type transport system involved in cytochrome bd biosynthesis fused ATPase/permease subunit